MSKSFYGVICTLVGMAECGALLSMVHKLEKREKRSRRMFIVFFGLLIGISSNVLVQFLERML